ncbi:MAG: hypothetical protein IGQ45_15395 [Cyanobacterium sp. T60_A2020_053]|nr:hypothetical protein [Cyanobacterium sp. T60_A2020_053]
MNLSVIAFILVIISSIGAGITTGFFSYTMGKDSLSGVATPNDNPTQKLQKPLNFDNLQEEFKIIPEQQVLVKVYDSIHQQKQILAEKRKQAENNK